MAFIRFAGNAIGYFVNNVIDAIAPDSAARNRMMWFPHETKQIRRTGVHQGDWGCVSNSSVVVISERHG